MNAEPEKKHPSHTRDHILEAAAKLVLTEGASGLTLDAVAKSAGISKGGLLYHFPSKEALILGMIGCRHQWFKATIQSEKDRLPDPDAAGAWHRAFVLAGFKTFIACNDLTAGMLAVVAQDNELVDRIHTGMKELAITREQDGVPRVVSNLIMSALDGIKMHSVIGLPMPSAQEIDELRELLLQMIDQSTKHRESA